jgi:DNA repair protein RadC
VIARALRILRSRLKRREATLQLQSVKDFLRLQARGLQHEVFAVMYLDAQHRLMAYERMFRGTLTQTQVHPREIARQAMKLNAAAVILHHNHPSGVCRPSLQDEAITHCVRAALKLLDVEMLDHVITCESEAVSMVESGLL